MSECDNIYILRDDVRELKVMLREKEKELENQKKKNLRLTNLVNTLERELRKYRKEREEPHALDGGYDY